MLALALALPIVLTGCEGDQSGTTQVKTDTAKQADIEKGIKENMAKGQNPYAKPGATPKAKK